MLISTRNEESSEEKASNYIFPCCTVSVAFARAGLRLLILTCILSGCTIYLQRLSVSLSVLARKWLRPPKLLLVCSCRCHRSAAVCSSDTRTRSRTLAAVAQADWPPTNQTPTQPRGSFDQLPELQPCMWVARSYTLFAQRFSNPLAFFAIQV